MVTKELKNELKTEFPIKLNLKWKRMLTPIDYGYNAFQFGLCISKFRWYTYQKRDPKSTRGWYKKVKSEENTNSLCTELKIFDKLSMQMVDDQILQGWEQ